LWETEREEKNEKNGDRIGAFGVFYYVDMSTWGRHFAFTDAR